MKYPKRTIDEIFGDVICTDIQDQPDIESFPRFFTDRDYLKYCFKQMRVAWLQQFGKNGKGTAIRRRLRGKPTEETIFFVKKVRSRGIMLRSAYRFFDQSHRTPQELKEFVFNLGVYGDNADPSRSQKRKKTVLVLQSKLKRPVFATKKGLKVRYATLENFRRYARSILVEIRGNLKNEVLDTERFHDTRKLLRQCSNLMQLPAVDDIGGAPHWLCIKLHQLSAVLGNAHATLVARHLSSNGYCKYEFAVTDEMREEFERLLPYLKKAIG